MDWVRQEDSHGCGAACFAMLTNRTYEGAKATIKHDGWDRSGIAGIVLDQYFAEEGIAIARRYSHIDGVERAVWPVAPFADVHLCQVTTVGGGHFVILLRDGTVVDPLDPQTHSLTDYLSVMNIAGLTRIGAW